MAYRSTGNKLEFSSSAADKKAVKAKPTQTKSLSYKKASQPNTNKGEAEYSRMTEDERETYKVAHGIAPTAADPSKYGVADRAEATAAKARGEKTKKELRADKVIKTREIDEAKYNSDLEKAKAANKAAKLAGGSTRSLTGRDEQTTKFSTIGSAQRSLATQALNARTAKKAQGISNFGFGSLGGQQTLGFGNMSTSGRTF